MRRSERRRRDCGQATVELALCLPMLCVLLLGVVQVAVVVRDQLAVELAAREAARAAAVAADATGAGTSAAHTAVRLEPLDVRITTAGATVTAAVRYVDHTDVPLIGMLLPDVTVSASATMQLEPP
jgi:Flp pilus assembly protein TadG